MKTRLILSFFLCTCFGALQGQITTSKTTPAAPLKKSLVKEVVNSLGQVMIDGYIFQEKGKAVADHLKANFKSKKYADIKSFKSLVGILQQDVQSIINDVHFNLFYFPSSAGFNWIDPGDSDEKKQDAENQMRIASELKNHGLPKLEILDGNVGYLKMASFNSPVHFVEQTVASAMQFLENTDAFILDVRDNGGGQPAYVNLIQSYFFKEGQLLAMKYNRGPDSTQHFYSLPGLNRDKYLEKPLYVLTSGGTGSGAEVIAYAIQSAKRGTIIGEKTIGGAHGFSTMNLSFEGHGNLIVGLPDSRMIDPNTQTNFEAVGVIPDIPVGTSKALQQAHLEAIKQLKSTSQSPEAASNLASIMNKIEFEMSNENTGASDYSIYTGRYGIRTISEEGGTLMIQRDGGPKLPLAPVGKDKFVLDIQLTPQPKIEFERTDGKVTAFYLIQGSNRTLNTRDN
ncbi:MAG: S41 family peptidase [Roseivirga sp.]|nr:S41 family peptidase [Roseivirga sp.]